MKFGILIILIFGGLIPGISAQNKNANLARFTILIPKEGMQKEFEDGYKRHLQWHIENGDSWNWYGWYVISGQRIGYFIDATFGHTWSDFDKPVNPAADRTDLFVNVLPFVNPSTQYTSVFLPEVSQSASGDLTARLQRFFYFSIRPGFEKEFRTFQRSFKKLMPQISSNQNFSWYKMEDGVEAVQFFLMLPHNSNAEYGKTADFFERLFERDETARENFRKSVEKFQTETLIYRADLTYLPKNDDSRKSK